MENAHCQPFLLQNFTFHSFPRPNPSKPFCLCLPDSVAASAGRSTKGEWTHWEWTRSLGDTVRVCVSVSLEATGAKMGIAKGRRSLWFSGNQLGWLMWQSLVFGEVVGRIIMLLPKAESLGFLLLCSCSAVSATCQGPAASSFGKHCFVLKQGWREDGTTLALFFPESILFLRLSGSLCTDRSLFPGQENWRQALDICQFLITFLTLYTLFPWNLFRLCLFLERLWDLLQNKVYLQ